MNLEGIEYANGGLVRLRQLTEELNNADSTELHYSRLWRDSGLGIAIVASNGTFLSLNKDYAQYLHCPIEMVVGTRWQDYTPEPERSQDQALVDKCLAGLIDGYVLPKRYGKNGNYSYVLLRVHAIRNEKNEFQYFFKTAQDLDHADLLKRLKGINE